MKANVKSKVTIEKVCKSCATKFIIYRSTLKNRPYKYCSKKCYDKNRVVLTGKDSPHWKGKLVGYGGLHHWIKKVSGKAVMCENCNSVKNVEWANISRKYKRVISDWKQLCRSCHHVFDDITSKRNRATNGRFI